jgi:hypothetical protein
MGYNSTVIVMNDALDMIAKDLDFGKKLAAAVLHLSVNDGKAIDVSAKNGNSCYANAATVVESHHADITTLVAIGGNYGTSLGTVLVHSHHRQEDKIEVLKQIANQLGFRLVKKK